MKAKGSDPAVRQSCISSSAFRRTRQHVLTMSIAGALHVGMICSASAQLFPAKIDLDTLGGNSGFRLAGEAIEDQAGVSVGAAGDFNGDGIDDLIVGARYADSGSLVDAGKCYVVFGSDGGLPETLGLSQLNGQNGLIINAEAAGDQLCLSSGAAGDINDDGISDVILSAFKSDVNGDDSGRSYVVFGSDAPFSNPFEMSSINGLNGIAFNGVAQGDQSGRSVSSAGDINGDGIDDLIIGADRADPGGNTSAGASYVVFGSDQGLGNPFALSGLNGLNGFVLLGIEAESRSGRPVSAAGDLNGDGLDDLVVAAHTSSVGPKAEAGRSYVIYGRDSAFPNPLDLATINGSNGVVLNGESAGDLSGASASAAGDVNGDGIGDLILGAPFAQANGQASAGRSYVVFGQAGGLVHPFELSSIDGLNGFVMDGEAQEDLSGYAVDSAGDINGDGIDDVIVGAPLADPDGSIEAGRSYVVFGRSDRPPNPLSLSSLDGSNGFVLDGAGGGHLAGRSVGRAGDINGDQVDDLVIGASSAGSFLTPELGYIYVLFGRGDRIFTDRFSND